MPEAMFCQEMTNWAKQELDLWKARVSEKAGEAQRLDLDRLVVLANARIASGRVPVWESGSKWGWQQFSREIDVVIARTGEIDGQAATIPLVAVELKTGSQLVTDVIDKKDGIYAALKEQYPCMMTCLVMRSNEVRGVQDATFLRNGRHFDRIITDWNERGQGILALSIQTHLDYAVGYWGR